MKNKLKDWMLPIAMAGGVLLHEWLGYLQFLSPYLIFMMLTITYCRIKPRDFKIGRFQWSLIGVQMLMAAIVLCALLPVNHTVATGLFICIFVSCATAAPVITGMLGGSITHVATYSLVCNLVVAIVGPAILAAIGDHSDLSFAQSFYRISSAVFPLLIMPIITAMILRYSWRRAHRFLATNQALSFYLWAITLFIVVGYTVSFVMKSFTISKLPEIIALTVGSAIICALQFSIGRRVGAHFGDKVSGGQALGQKNTVLAIWLALTYLNPIASIAPAAYIAWHNIVNSYQIIHYHKTHGAIQK